MTQLPEASQLAELQQKAAEQETRLARYEAERAQQDRNLALFDTMDFDVFSKQDWPGFKQTHSASTRVVMPDGSVVTGIARHTQDMIAMFGYLPDLRVEEHSVKVAAGDWTAVVGRFTGTFSRPMPLPGGGSIPPTGKTVHMPMATFARWEDGQIAEEILFWDSGEFMKQLGLAQ